MNCIFGYKNDFIIDRYSFLAKFFGTKVSMSGSVNLTDKVCLYVAHNTAGVKNRSPLAEGMLAAFAIANNFHFVGFKCEANDDTGFCVPTLVPNTATVRLPTIVCFHYWHSEYIDRALTIPFPLTKCATLHYKLKRQMATKQSNDQKSFLNAARTLLNRI